jgi:LmbE family N-acetylglucosaminyl deacetylase
MICRENSGAGFGAFHAARQSAREILVVTAHAEDYVIGAGGTLAKLMDEGYSPAAVQVTNDEKNSAGPGPA